ncbi:MAG: MFS transporter, partial [Chloroflexi bacterium]|nr:MFS transporter [Chloroflexota bacterium]
MERDPEAERDPREGARARAREGESVWGPTRRGLTIGLVATVTLVAFEALAVAAVMPLVARELGDVALYGWAFSGFFLGNLVGIVAAGGAIDRVGVVRPLLVGLLLFAVGVLIAGVAASMPILVLGRIVQGVGAGAIPAVAYVTISRRYEERTRPQMFAILSTAWVVPGLLGPALAGWIGDHLTWRLVFLGLLPFILLFGGFTLRALRSRDDADRTDGMPAGRRAEARRLGAAILVTAGAALLLAASTAPTAPFAIPMAVGGLVIGLPALRRLLPAGTLTAARGLPATVLARGVLTFAFFGAEAYLPLALVEVRGTTATEAGLALTAATLSWTAGAWIQAHRFSSWGGRRLVGLGFAVVAVGVGTTAVILLPGVPVLVSVATWGVVGLGMGLAYSTLSLLVLRDAPAGQQGAATSSLQLSDVLGTSLGTGVGGAVIASAAMSGTSTALGIAAAFGISLAVGIGGIVLSR